MPGMCLGKVAKDEELKTEICGNMYTCIFIFIYLQMYIYLHIYIYAHIFVLFTFTYTQYTVYIYHQLFFGRVKLGGGLNASSLEMVEFGS